MVSGGLIALYLVVYYATGAGRLLREAGGVYVDSIRTFQGR